MNVPTQSPPPKKGMSPLAWIGIGCAVVIVLGIMAFGVLGFFAKRALDKVKDNPGMAAAELAVRANPDLELVSSDPKTNTLTVKNKKSGETVTFSAEDAKNGRFTVKTDKGTASFDASGSKDGGGTLKVTDEKGQTTTFQSGAAAVKNLPSWVPTYPGGTVQGTFDANTADGHSASFSVATQDSVEKVVDWYESQLKSAGLKVEKNTYATNGATAGGTVTGKSDDDKRQVTVVVTGQGSAAQALVSFQDKK